MAQKCQFLAISVAQECQSLAISMVQKCQSQIFEVGQKIGPISVAYKCHLNAEIRPICLHVSHFGPVPGVGRFLYRG